VTTFGGTTISQTGPASYLNFANGGPLAVAPGLAAVSMNGFANTVGGQVTVGAGSQVNAADFESSGVLTLAPAVSPAVTRLTNTGTAPLAFGGGSRTFIGTPATTSQFAASIDLNGKNAVVAGGLLVNNGFVVDSATGGAARVVADFGALVKGGGFYQSPVLTQNGGRFQAGNSPGTASFGCFTFGPGGVDRYVFSINDATGTAGQVNGWGLVTLVQQQLGATTTSGDFAWTADPDHRLTFTLETLLNPTAAGTDMAGPMDHFDPARPYAWSVVRWAGAYSGPTDVAALTAATAFDPAGFANPIGGTFGWALDTARRSLSLTYTPVPEPSSLALVAAAAGLAYRRCRRAR
jgi:hypothetical protein